MGYKTVLSKHFDRVYREVDFVKKTYNSLNKLGFTGENTIASVCICRDEISQSMRSLIKYMWGEAFNLSSLAGMFTAGKTGLTAAMHHAPEADGKERYVYYILPHTAIDEEGRTGFCSRKGRKESTACGALSLFLNELNELKELYDGKVYISIDEDDIEKSLIRRRLLKEIPDGYVPDLIELTKIARRVIQSDIEHALRKVVDIAKSDYALITGIQIHVPDGNYVWPSECYAVVNGVKKDIKEAQ